MSDAYRLEMKNISKRFGGVNALTDVSFSVKAGESHALVGENGAGKSTLMKILSGAYQRDRGEIFIDGQNVKISSPRDAKQYGVAVIYQEFMLAPDLTVAENIYIDKLAYGKKLINWKLLKKNAKEQLTKLGFDNISPSAKVAALSVAQQQVVEICKCLTRNAKILVLDEPTAVLTFAEIEKLFQIIQKLKKEGVSIIYISHRLEEIFEICDKVTILKDGGYVDMLDVNNTDRTAIVNKMVGRELTALFPKRNAQIGDVVLKVEKLYTAGFVRDVSFEVRAGEVLGFSGLVGAGRTEVMRAIFGADKRSAGSVYLSGEKVDFRHPKEAKEKGLGLIPEDRKRQGLILDQSIRINATMPVLERITNRTGLIHKKKETEHVQKLLASISTKYGDVEDNVSSLSGGNQQKVVLAKWVDADCKCIIFDEPTRGVDVGAKVEIYNIMNSLAEAGVAIIMISSELQEIIGMCDRVIIMRQGQISGELDAPALSEENLIQYAMG